MDLSATEFLLTRASIFSREMQRLGFTVPSFRHISFTTRRGSFTSKFTTLLACRYSERKRTFPHQLIREQVTVLDHDDYRPHVGVNVAMIGKRAGCLEGKTIGPTDGNGATIKCRSIVTGHCMGYRRHVLPGHGRARPNLKLRGSKAKAPITIVGNQHHLCKARGRRQGWLSDSRGGRRLSDGGRRCRCRCRSRA